jgi:hypothetical protein
VQEFPDLLKLAYTFGRRDWRIFCPLLDRDSEKLEEHSELAYVASINAVDISSASMGGGVQ